MRAKLGSWLTIMLSSAMLSTTNSCVGGNYAIQLITDAGIVTDKSFNEQAYNGVKNNIGIKEHNLTHNFQRPESNSEQAFLNAYNAARLSGMQVMVASGFWHQSLGTLEKFATLMPETKYVTIDFDMQNANLDWDKVKIAQLDYRSEESGFFAAIAGALHLNKINEKKELKMSTFGGAMIPPVIRFMAGYKMGINWWNKEDNKSKILPILQLNNADFNDKNFKKINFIGGSKENHFSDSFTLNAPKVQNILDRLISVQGVDIIMPVAGPQTLNVINYIKSKKKDTKIIGVDTDQAKIFENDKDLFISSALKEVEKSVTQTIDAIYSNDEDKFFKKDKNLGGIKEGWTGIPVSKYINEKEREMIYETFKADNWESLREALHKPWEELEQIPLENIWDKIVELK